MKNEISNKNYELIKFEDVDFGLDVNVSPNKDTVWLAQAEIAELYDVDRSRITRHINHILDDKELPFSVCAENAHTALDGKVYNGANSILKNIF